LSRRTSRSTRTRGPAIQPPSIPVELAPGSALHLRSCFVSGTPEPVVRLTVKVYPPAVCFLLSYLSRAEADITLGTWSSVYSLPIPEGIV
jgi:hypothetical protein